MSNSSKKSKRTRRQNKRSPLKKDRGLQNQIIHSLKLFDMDHLRMSKWKSDDTSDFLQFAIWERGQLVAMVNSEQTAELLMLGLWSKRLIRDEVWREFQFVKNRVRESL